MSHSQSPSDHRQSAVGDLPVVVEFAIPAEDLALAKALGEFPDVSIEFEQLVPTNHRSMPFFWATDGKLPAFQKAVADDPDVAHLHKAATFEGGALYGVEWAANPNGLLNWSVNNHGTAAIIKAHGQADGWVLKIRFPNRTHLTDFQTFCKREEIDLRIVRLYDLTSPKTGEYNISEKQREALLRALEMGHFNIPREATLEDIAESLGISARAVSERLRRGQTNLVSNTLSIVQPVGVGLEGR